MYTPEMEKAVRDAAPLDLAGAKALGSELGMSYRSVIAKTKSLGLTYISKPVPARKPKEVTKAELVTELAGSLEMKLDGLEKAPRATLLALVARLA